MSIKLLHTNCDGHGVWAEWETKPTRSELTDFFNDYYDTDVSDELAKTLFEGDTAHVENASCDSFELI